MTGIKILCVGKIKEKYFADGIAYYSKIIGEKSDFSIIECADQPTPDKAPSSVEEQIKKTEGKRLLSHIREEDYVIALCIDGTQYSSEAWKQHIKKVANTRSRSGSLVFVIGGSLGLSDEVVRRANEKISFSAMTFPHQMMRMILCEQLAFVL